MISTGFLAVPKAAQTPLGATLVTGGVQFAVFSQNSTWPAGQRVQGDGQGPSTPRGSRSGSTWSSTTLEGGSCGGNPVRYINLRGLDNATYYTLADDKTCYWESTGTGNNLNASRPAVRRLIKDGLAYWHEEMGVDG